MFQSYCVRASCNLIHIPKTNIDQRWTGLWEQNQFHSETSVHTWSSLHHCMAVLANKRPWLFSSCPSALKLGYNQDGVVAKGGRRKQRRHSDWEFCMNSQKLIHFRFTEPYSMVGNFCGRKLSQIGGFSWRKLSWIVHWCCQRTPHPQILQRKLSKIASKPRKFPTIQI